jgi:hypothetical protein
LIKTLPVDEINKTFDDHLGVGLMMALSRALKISLP